MEKTKARLGSILLLTAIPYLRTCPSVPSLGYYCGWPPSISFFFCTPPLVPLPLSYAFPSHHLHRPVIHYDLCYSLFSSLLSRLHLLSLSSPIFLFSIFSLLTFPLFSSSPQFSRPKTTIIPDLLYFPRSRHIYIPRLLTHQTSTFASDHRSLLADLFLRTVICLVRV
ncbi:hypothetical protein BDV39DRAFT_65676 [Aspergillus sergii]|uniref:Uncharacterized protein n=1 Tax=Aspergillus sergii TaxID=1034303 RepID=A0A5N6XAW6_9EURO|nr:hypothetical protein BDV39DRAFT_65676 [Aspergillus sergii]